MRHRRSSQPPLSNQRPKVDPDSVGIELVRPIRAQVESLYAALLSEGADVPLLYPLVNLRPVDVEVLLWEAVFIHSGFEPDEFCLGSEPDEIEVVFESARSDTPTSSLGRLVRNFDIAVQAGRAGELVIGDPTPSIWSMCVLSNFYAWAPVGLEIAYDDYRSSPHRSATSCDADLRATIAAHPPLAAALAIHENIFERDFDPEDNSNIPPRPRIYASIYEMLPDADKRIAMVKSIYMVAKRRMRTGPRRKTSSIRRP